MKYLLFAILLFSCTKDNNSPGSQDEEISYDVNSEHHSHKGEQTADRNYEGIYSLKVKGIQGGIETFYSIAANSGPDDMIQLIIITDSLQETKYHLLQGTGSIISVNQVGYSFLQQDDYLDVTISGYRNGTVSGVFSGKLSKAISLNPLILESATISNGKISNVIMHY